MLRNRAEVSCNQHQLLQKWPSHGQAAANLDIFRKAKAQNCCKNVLFPSLGFLHSHTLELRETDKTANKLARWACLIKILNSFLLRTLELANHVPNCSVLHACVESRRIPLGQNCICAECGWGLIPKQSCCSSQGLSPGFRQERFSPKAANSS